MASRAVVGPRARNTENRVALSIGARGVLGARALLKHAALLEVGDDTVGDVGGCVVDWGGGGDSEAEDDGEGYDGELHFDWKWLERGFLVGIEFVDCLKLELRMGWGDGLWRDIVAPLYFFFEAR